MSTGAIVAVVTLIAVVAIYMHHTICEISEMRRALERIERRQKLPIMKSPDTSRVERPDIEVVDWHE